MSQKAETYRLLRTNNIERLIDDLNRVMTMLEDRLDTLEGLRNGYFTTQRWERDEIGGGE